MAIVGVYMGLSADIREERKYLRMEKLGSRCTEVGRRQALGQQAEGEAICPGRQWIC